VERGHGALRQRGEQGRVRQGARHVRPRIGGFCSFAASRGATAKCDPLAWHIEGGKLYVFNDLAFRDKFVAEIKDGVIAKAEANWAKHLEAVDR
jgi:hypothetical protein